MKKIFLLLFIITASLAVTAQEKTPYMTKSLSSESVKSTEVQTSGGSISVTGVNSAAETKVEVYISSNNGRDNISKEEIEKRLEEYDLNVTAINKTPAAILNNIQIVFGFTCSTEPPTIFVSVCAVFSGCNP